MMHLRRVWVALVLIGVSTESLAAIPKFSEVDPGKVYRGAQPTEKIDFQWLRDEVYFGAIVRIFLPLPA